MVAVRGPPHITTYGCSTRFVAAEAPSVQAPPPQESLLSPSQCNLGDEACPEACTISDQPHPGRQIQVAKRKD